MQRDAITFAASPDLQSIVEAAAHRALQNFGARNFRPDEFALTLVDLNSPAKPVRASYRGGEKTYPASVIKLFYLVAAHRWMEDGKLADTLELRRAMRDMIVDSSNEATGLVVDELTDTTSGPEMASPDLEIWHDKRNAVNRYFFSVGFTDINANRKPWNDGPYGREQQSVLIHTNDARNALTTDSTARLLSEIMTDRSITAERSDQMRELLKRDPADRNEQGQVKGFIGEVLPAGAKLWSKAGWMSRARHDAAAFQFPDGRKYLLVIFTVNHANEPEILQSIARTVMGNLLEKS